jgi:uncharacterized protein (DUF4415 family)
MQEKKDAIMHYSLDPHNPPPLTDKQKAELEALAAMPDSEIDYSDIPAAQPSYSSSKETATVRLDSDILAWLRSYGNGYQAKINAVLRRAMLADKQGEHL